MYDGDRRSTGMQSADALMAAAPRPSRRPDVDAPGATMIYTSGTTGKPKGALRRGAGDPSQVAALLAAHRLHARRRLHHAPGRSTTPAPAASWASPRCWARPSSLQRKFDPEDWLRLVDTVPGHVHVLGADADPHGLQRCPTR